MTLYQMQVLIGIYDALGDGAGARLEAREHPELCGCSDIELPDDRSCAPDGRGAGGLPRE